MGELLNSGLLNMASLMISLVVLLVGLVIWFFVNRASSRTNEQIELLELDKSGIHVAEYLTSLPPRAVLGERLQQAAERARLQIEQRKTDSE